jgi:hypothetical protein
VVHHQQPLVAALARAVAGGVEAEEVDAVVVVPDLLLLVGGGVAGVGLPGRGRRVDRLAPGQEGGGGWAAIARSTTSVRLGLWVGFEMPSSSRMPCAMLDPPG